jgi:IS30 family transposase
MWYKIRELYSKGFNKTQIAFQLGLHRSTVRRYLKMDEDTLTAKLQHRRQYPRILDKYESYVCDILSRYRFLSASQIHDWMKEQYPDLPVVCGKTVYNFVEAVRRKYNLDKEGLSKRVYEKMPDTPYGEYAQMDFGEAVCPRTGAVLSRSIFLSW